MKGCPIINNHACAKIYDEYENLAFVVIASG